MGVKFALTTRAELDPLEKWVELLSPFGTAREVSAESPPDFHVLLLLKQLEGARNFDDASIMGGVVFEYYVSSNTGLLTYLLVSSKYRSLGACTLPDLLSVRVT